MPVVVVDAGPLVAWGDRLDPRHEDSKRALERPEFDLVLASLALAEASYIIARRLGPRAEATLIRALASFEQAAPTPDDMLRMADLMEQYVDFPLGAADASIIALAERFETDLILTLDQRHFRAIRPRHVDSFTLVP